MMTHHHHYHQWCGVRVVVEIKLSIQNQNQKKSGSYNLDHLAKVTVTEIKKKILNSGSLVTKKKKKMKFLLCETRN